jgi:hypothetical protein
MVSRKHASLFSAGTALLVLSCMCGLAGAAPAGNTPPPAATVDLGQPSGGGGGPLEPTVVSLTSIPLVLRPTATAAGPSQPIPVAPPPAIPESRRLTLEYPPSIRTGDSDVIRLTLEVDPLGNLTPTAEVQGNTVIGTTVQVPNLYDTHNVTAEARLDLAGMEVRPPEAVSEPLLPGESVTFYWSVRPTGSGTYRGTAWLFLRYVDKVSGEESRNALSAQPVKIEGTSLFGLSGNAARAAGGLGSLVGAVLGIPFMDDLLKFLWGRLRRKSNV